MQRNHARNLAAAGLAFLAALLPVALLHAADTETTPAVDRIQVTWTETVLTTPDRPRTRGFGGRLMFFEREGNAPVKVDGTLIVYAFDETSRPPDGTPPDRKFVFQDDQLQKHYSKSALGHSYSVWLPWDDADRPPRRISLIPRIIPTAGQPVIGESAELALTQYKPNAISQRVKPNPVRLTSHVEPAMHDTIEELRRERAELQSRLRRVEQELQQARAMMASSGVTDRPQATVTGSLIRVAEKLEANMRANLAQLWSAWDRPLHRRSIVESSQPLPMARSFRLLADAGDVASLSIQPDSTATLSGRKPIATLPTLVPENRDALTDEFELSFDPKRDAKRATFGLPALTAVAITRSGKTLQPSWPEIPRVAPPQPSDSAWFPSETLAMTWPDGPLLGHEIARLPFDFPFLPPTDNPIGDPLCAWLNEDRDRADVLSFPRVLHEEADAAGPSACVFREEWLVDWEKTYVEPVAATPMPLDGRASTLNPYNFVDGKWVNGNFVDDVQYYAPGPEFTIAREVSLIRRSSPLPEYEPNETSKPQPDRFEPDSSLAADALLDDDTLLILAQAVKAYQTKLAVIANNLANAETVGFKASRVNLENLPCRHEELPGILDSVGNYTPVGVTLGMGVCVAGTQTNFTQGSLQEGAQLDVAILGKGFFQVTNTSGEIQYTRAGRFATNANGDLVLASSKTGRVVEPSITIPPDATEIVISSEGEVSVRQPGTQGLTAVGCVELAAFINPQGLLAEGENLYDETDASGSPTTGTPGQEGLGKLQQGKLEASNVDSTEELIEFKRTAAKLKTIKTMLLAE